MSKDIVRVLRIVEYTGPRDAVEAQVSRSIHGQVMYPGLNKGQVIIRAATIGLYPELLERISDANETQG